MGTWGRCSKCKKQIIWITTLKGKLMPVDPEVLIYKPNKSGKELLVTPEGATVRCDILLKQEPGCRIGYRSHFATCTHAKEFRKGKG